MSSSEVRIPVRDVSSTRSGQEDSSSMLEKAKDAATAVVEKTRGTASAIVEKTEEIASNVAGKVSDVASTIGHKTSDAASAVVENVEAGVEYVRREGVQGMVKDVGNVIRRHPWPSMAIGFALGLLLANLRRK